MKFNSMIMTLTETSQIKTDIFIITRIILLLNILLLLNTNNFSFKKYILICFSFLSKKKSSSTLINSLYSSLCFSLSLCESK